MTDEWLCRQMTEAFECFAEQPIPEHVFSPGFEKKMEKLIRQEETKGTFWKTAGWGKKAGMVAAISLTLAASATFGVKANREKFFQMVTQWIDGMKQTTYEIEETSGQLSLAEPSWLPQGYQKTDEEILENEMLMVQYENAQGSQIIFTRERVSEDLVIYEDSAFDLQEELVVNGHEILYTERNGDMAYKMLSWYEQDLYYTIMTDGAEKEDLIRIAESVEWN
ncbi:MAG: DUF4367 domain-containing protein [Eubacteriales bacterium]|nr:DUF4367 domain-containing protein [Eubacteriales bacterium]